MFKGRRRERGNTGTSGEGEGDQRSIYYILEGGFFFFLYLYVCLYVIRALECYIIVQIFVSTGLKGRLDCGLYDGAL